MSNVKIQGNVSGTGSLTIAAPNTNTDRTLTLPDESGTLLSDSGAISVSASAPDNSIVINASGNLGIGTSSPSTYGFQTVNNVTYNGTSAGIYCANPNVNVYMVANAAAGGAAYIGTKGSNALAFTTTDTERMRIDSSGNLLVGTASPLFSGLVTFKKSGGNSLVCWQEAGSAAAAIVARIDNTSGRFIGFNYAGTDVGTITTNGSSTSYNTSSDYRLKEDIQPMTGALAKVAALKPCTYKWKSDGSDGEGFIAHELAEVVPQCVTGAKDAVDAEGNPQYQGIDTSFLVATLTAAIQELKVELDTVKAELAAMKGTA